MATLSLALLLLLSCCGTARCSSDGSWSQRHLSRYTTMRAGPRSSSSGRLWRGRGVLSNTLSGRRIAEVECLERCVRVGEHEIESDRVVVYRDGNGTRLAPPLRYAHNVSMELREGGHVLLRASKWAASRSGNDGAAQRAGSGSGGGSDGAGGGGGSGGGGGGGGHDADGSRRSIVASGWAAGRGPQRRGLLRRALYELSVRPIKDDAASLEAPPARETTPVGLPRVADRTKLGVTREDYVLEAPSLPGRPCTMTYKRTGRCPHWYGGGVCTLELTCTAEQGDGRGGGEAASELDALAQEEGGGAQRPWWRFWAR